MPGAQAQAAAALSAAESVAVGAAALQDAASDTAPAHGGCAAAAQLGCWLDGQAVAAAVAAVHLQCAVV